MTDELAYKYCSCRDANGNKLGAKCPRLRRPSGAWNSHHGAWYYQIELPTKPDGNRWQLRRRNFDSLDDAKADRAQAEALLQLAGDDDIVRHEIARMLKQTKQGQPFPARDDIARRVRAGVPATTTITVGEFLWKWHARRKIEASTLRSYGTHIRVHLVPHLGHIPLHKLRNSHIEAMFNAIADRNIQIDVARSSDDAEVRASVKGARTVSSATMQRIRATLRKALNDAIRKDRLLEFNHAVHVELPSGKAPKAKVWTAGAVREWEETGRQPSPVMVWTPEQAGAFLDYAHDHDIILYPIVVLILHRGLRRGEAIGLRDTDVDLTDGTVTISQQITTLGYEPVVKKVKSEAGDRLVTLDTSTTAALRSYHARRARWQLVSGSGWPDTGLFFVQPGGNAWHPQQITDRFERLVAACGLPPIRLHDLRHCAATFLKASGSDLKDIQAILGHATLAITADIYTLVIHELETERAKANAAAALVPRTTRRAG